MGTYVAFLRGINLGPTNKISMPALRELAADLGYTDVRTYINSGNLIFSSTKSAATLEREISAAIKSTIGHRIDVAVRTPAQLKKVLTNNPYPDGNPSQVTVAFLTKASGSRRQGRRSRPSPQEYEPFTFAGKEVYVHYSQGLGTSKLAEKFSAIIGVSATVRNIRTVEKVIALCDR